MTVTEQQLQSFIDLFKQEFGIQLSASDARFRAESLLYFIACSFKRKDAETNKSDILKEPGLSNNTHNFFIPKKGQ